MRYGYFDNTAQEYVIDQPDIPVSFTNYLGTQQMGAVISHNAGGYCWLDSPQYHRITRFRPNGVPLDRPGHYVYLRDEETGKYWSASWQPTGLPLAEARYECRHGLGYSTFSCQRQALRLRQTLFIPREDPVELWDVTVSNTGDTSRELGLFGYVEFSYHHIEMDNQNFQMSLYASGSRYKQGAVEYALHYEEDSYQYFAASFEPHSFDCLRDSFIGPYRTETDPLGVDRGRLSGSEGDCGNHCGALHRRFTLAPGETARFIFILGTGDTGEAARARAKYTPSQVDEAFAALRAFWEERLAALQVDTLNDAMNTSLNIWNYYQSQVNVSFSRFASFIEVGGRTGLGYRDTAQDAMCIPHGDPEGCLNRIVQLLHGQVRMGYGLHLFGPAWFEPWKRQSFNSPTVVPTPDRAAMIHGLKDTCADDALWLIPAISEYIRETGDLALLQRVVPYADGGEVTVYQHMKAILDFSFSQIGEHGVCKGLRADWNDCLNLGGGESAVVSFLLLWAVSHFLPLASEADRTAYAAQAEAMKAACQRELWDGQWFLRGITGKGQPIGSRLSEEGKVHLESNTWAVIGGGADREQALSRMDAVDEYLFTPYGLMLNAPSFRTPNDDVGFVTRVYPGVKENGSIFSHPNPWAWVAECLLGRGTRAMKFYNALLPENQNDRIEVRRAEPYAYCQFIMGKEHPRYGQANPSLDDRLRRVELLRSRSLYLRHSAHAG